MALAEPTIAPHDLPPFTNSAMDGYALRAEDTRDPPVTLRVVEVVPAGRPPEGTLRPGSAAKVMTGAALPQGADAVVPVENTSPAGEGLVTVLAEIATANCVRKAGEESRAGDEVFPRGARLGPAHLGVLASLGIAAPLVGRRLRVGVLSTGNELLSPGAETLIPGHIRDANSSLLAGMLAELNVDVVDLGLIPDEVDLLRDALSKGVAETDAVVTSGGVAMGDFDVMRQVFARFGGFEFWQIAAQPGKPLAFGTVGSVPVFGLPGNPVAAAVAFEQLVRPALLHSMGSRLAFRARIPASMGEPVSTNPQKVVFLRVKADRTGENCVVRLSGAQGSGVLSALANADAFAVVPVGIGDLPAGSPVELELFLSPEARTVEEAIGWH